MGMIKKKTAVRGTEGGVKYICDVCSADITSTVRIHCAHPDCKGEYDLCVTCFSQGSASSRHDPATHSYQVVEQHSVPIFTDDWGADEETLLLEGAETYGLGSWADIADHIGGFRDKDEVQDHYIKTYVDSSRFPLPEHCSPNDRELMEEWPREKFQARKRRRIEDKKEAAKNEAPAQPKQKPVSSVPSCHEVQGFMPGRLEFETEHYNEAEEAVQHMQFEPGEGVNEKGELDQEMVLKMTVMEIYNTKLNARVERKKFMFDHELLEYRRNQTHEKKKSKEERDLYARCKPVARLMSKADFDIFSADLEYELNLRQAIAQLQDWRVMQISDLKSGERYEQEKAARLSKQAAQAQFERFATPRPQAKGAGQPQETSAAVQELTKQDLELRPMPGAASAASTPAAGTTNGDPRVLANGTGNAAPQPVPLASRPKFTIPPQNNAPFKFTIENTPDLHLLNTDERDLCAQLRIMPKAYTAMKDSVLREAMKAGGIMRKKTAREICRIDSTKGSKLFDFFVYSGWIAKA